jgi:ABC-type dipeptide/oligopeptide/nickel transport system permease component
VARLDRHQLAAAVIRFIVGRLVASIGVIFVVATASFLLLHAAPGGPFETDARRSAAEQRALEDRYHLHDSMWSQYWTEIGALAHGDLGRSMKKDTSVNHLIAEHGPVSALVGALGILTALIFGVAMGVTAAWKKNTRTDYALMAIALVGISVPSFVLGPMLVAWLSIHWGLLPPARLDGVASYILPALTLGFIYLGTIARLARGGMLDALSQDFIRTARAKGLPDRRVVWKHALRVGILPVVTYLGPATAAMISGSFVVEKIFQIPGLGTYFINSITDRDYPVLTGVFVFYATLLVLLNLVVDLAYGWIDPRARRRP